MPLITQSQTRRSQCMGKWRMSICLPSRRSAPTDPIRPDATIAPHQNTWLTGRCCYDQRSHVTPEECSLPARVLLEQWSSHMDKIKFALGMTERAIYNQWTAGESSNHDAAHCSSSARGREPLRHSLMLIHVPYKFLTLFFGQPNSTGSHSPPA